MPPLSFAPGGELSVAELHAARLDGELVELDIGFVAAGVPLDAPARASSLRHLVPAGYAAVSTAAAWIHGVLDERPSVVRARRVEGRSRSASHRSGVALSSRAVAAGDVAPVERLLVTTLPRTLYDTWRSVLDGTADDAARDACAVLRADERTAAGLARWIRGSSRMPHVRAMRDELAREGHDVRTR